MILEAGLCAFVAGLGCMKMAIFIKGTGGRGEGRGFQYYKDVCQKQQFCEYRTYVQVPAA